MEFKTNSDNIKIDPTFVIRQGINLFLKENNTSLRNSFIECIKSIKTYMDFIFNEYKEKNVFSKRLLVEYSIPIIRILTKKDKNEKIIFIEEGVLIWNNILFEKGASFRLFENEIKIITPYHVFECTPLKIEKEMLIYSDYESFGESFESLKEDNFALEGLKLLDIDIDELIQSSDNNERDTMTEIKFISIYFPDLNDNCKGRLIAYEEFCIDETLANSDRSAFFSEFDDFAVELIDKTSPHAFINIEISSSVETQNNPEGIYFDTFGELWGKTKRDMLSETFLVKYLSTLDNLVETLRI